MISAPNSIYPLFVVAPANRKSRLREQLRRTTFNQMEPDKKVRLLSYEAIDDVDRFFGQSTSGLRVDVIAG